MKKTEYFKKFNIRLIHIFEDEWLNFESLIKLKLISILHKDIQTIYAKDCQVKFISTSIKNNFISKYSFNIIDKSKIKLGLYFKNELIGIMTFTDLLNNNWELNNYLTNIRILGRSR